MSKITIQVDGKDVGLRFDYPAIKWFIKAGVAVAELTGEKDTYWVLDAKGDPTGDMTAEGLAKLIECGYRNDCLIKEVKPSIPYESFIDFVGTADKSVLVDIMNCYADSSVLKKPIAEEEKKRLPMNPSISTPSSPSATESLAGDPGNLSEQPSETSSLPLTG